jgi:hypothetical protein
MCPRSIAQRRVGTMAITVMRTAAIEVGGGVTTIAAAMAAMTTGVVDAPDPEVTWL